MTEMTAAPYFYENLQRFEGRPALVEPASGRVISYRELEQLAGHRQAQLPQQRGLIFIEADNAIATLIDYIAALRLGHAVYLTDNLADPKSEDLIARYQPNWLLLRSGEIEARNAAPIELHPDLRVLLSTSGSTGSAKFVKLSAKNLDANARSIAEYFGLSPTERAMQHLKPSYSFGLSIINSHLLVGGALILSQRRTVEDEFWAEMKSFEATSFSGVPYTFETLAHRGFDPHAYPSLSYVAQAGGRLDPALVKSIAADLKAANVRFFVMYGQTEAAPRISYLPPDRVEQHPDSIGKAIPGGTLYLVDGKGMRIATPETEGELAYEGPNVMMGYANLTSDLASDNTPERLLTGDIAYFRDDLFYITGRTSRFVKPFGIRLNLDEVQAYVTTAFASCLVVGTDKLIIIAHKTSDASSFPRAALEQIGKRFNLPAALFKLTAYESFPLLPNGKYDLRTILSGETEGRAANPFKRGLDAVVEILGLGDNTFVSVEDAFISVLALDGVDGKKRYVDLSADSLSYVTLALELETLLAEDLPPDWHERTIDDLEQIYNRKVFA